MKGVLRLAVAARWPRRELVGWLVVALLVRAATLAVVTQPGYMDASYYYHVAENLVAGRGLVTDADLELPRSAHRSCRVRAMPTGRRARHWSLRSVAGCSVPAFGVPRYRWCCSRQLWCPSPTCTVGCYSARDAVVTGVAALMLCSAAYYPYWVTTDTFTPYGVLGIGCFLLLGWALRVEPASRARLIAAVGGAGVLAGWSQIGASRWPGAGDYCRRHGCRGRLGAADLPPSPLPTGRED